MTYDAYGLARHHWAADLTGDGAVNDDDRAAMNAALNESIGDQDYNVDADVTRTGRVTMTDAAHTGTSQYKAALPKGDLSGAAASGGGGWNTIGYCGYVFNPEVPTTGGGGGLYTVRFRHYDAEIGRWLERDPLGYVDGMNLYGYVMGSPLVFSDPFGLSADDKPWWRRTWEWIDDTWIRGNNPVHRWIGDNFWRRIHTDEYLATMPAWWLYSEAVLYAVLGGYFGWLLGAELGGLMLSRATYAAMVRAIGANATGWQKLIWLIRNGHLLELLTYWIRHPVLFSRFIRTTWPPTLAARVFGPVALYLFYRYVRRVYEESFGSSPQRSVPSRGVAPSRDESESIPYWKLFEDCSRNHSPPHQPSRWE